MFKVAVGHSEDPDTEDAVNDVIAQCRSNLGEIAPQAGIIFSAIEYEQPVILKKIRDAFPNIQLVGCSSGGELSSRIGYAEGSLLLITFASDTVFMATGVVREMSKDIKANVQTALAEIKTKLTGEPVFCLIFPDIFTIGTVRLVEEMKQILGVNFPVFGGGASDPWKFDQTHEFYNDEVLQDAAPMLFFTGPIEFMFGVVSGWEPFTSKQLIMECNKNVAVRIGEMSALEYYQHYLGGPPTLAHPLAVFEDGQQRFYLRAPLQIDEKTGSIVFGGDLPQQATTSICQADPQNLIAETERLVHDVIAQDANKKLACVMVISCSCRQKILGTKTKEEYSVLSKEVAPEVPIFGFYAYGQVSPFNKHHSSFVHNESVVAILLNEKT